MKQYEIVHLNKGTRFSREKDIELAQDTINAQAAEGWELLQIVSPNDAGGVMYGVFVKEVQ